MPASDPPNRPSVAAPSQGTLAAARRIELIGQWGRVFGPLDLDLEAGGVNLLVAPQGAARTALLMALCGRMKLSGGDLTVLGRRNEPRATFADSAIACFDELDDVLPSVTIQDLVTEQLRWESPWYRWVPKATAMQVEEMCGYLFEDLPLPPLDAFVADLPVIEQMLVRIAIANTRRPPLLVVGRLDEIADNAQRDQLVATLLKLGGEQSVVSADVNRGQYAFAGIKHVEVPQLLEFQQRSAVAGQIAAQASQGGGAL